MKFRLAIVLALVVVFTAGAAAGWAYGRREGLSRSQRTPPRPEDMQRRVIEGLQRDLELTPEQLAKIEPIINETWGKIGELQKGTGRQIREMVRAQHQRFKEFLTETQWAKLQEIEARRSKRHGDRGGGGGGGGGGGSPGAGAAGAEPPTGVRPPPDSSPK